jgi:hypothetical protein
MSSKNFHQSFETQYGRKPAAGIDYDPDSALCQDDYEYFTGTGAYADKTTMNTQTAITLLKNAGFKVAQAPGGAILVSLTNRRLDKMEVSLFFAKYDLPAGTRIEQISHGVIISGLPL